MRITVPMLKILGEFLKDTEKPQYGLELSKATGIASGSLYPILMRLEREKWLESRLEEIDEQKEGRPARKYYTITALGIRLTENEWRKLNSLAPILRWLTC